MPEPLNTDGGLSASTRDLLTDPALGARPLEVMAGTILFEPEMPADRLFYIQSGQVRLYQVGPDNSGRLVEILGPGDWFGTASLIDAQAVGYGTRAVAVSQTVITEVSAAKWLGCLDHHSNVATQWVRRLAGKLEAARADAACLVFDDCNQRLIRALVNLSNSAAATPHEEGVVLRITHHQLAQAVGAARETVSLALTQLRQRNLLRTGRNQLFFNPGALARFSDRPMSEPESSEQLA